MKKDRNRFPVFQLVDKVTKKWLDRQAFFVKMCVESNFWRFYHVDQTL
ncbi:hypothetical protein B4094_1324 [Bacillus licheniformis]|nr:hypothetical protein B4094_1324 [Bacillus licheniformis]